MPKIKNMYGVTYEPTHKNRHKPENDPPTKSPSRSGLVKFLFFQIFVCLSILIVSPNVWAQVPTVKLSVVDTDGDDEVFNRENQKLRITISVGGDPTRDDDDPYNYTLKVNGHDDIELISGDKTINKNETKTVIDEWDGGTLLDGTYTLRVEILVDEEEGSENNPSSEAEFTIDTIKPEVSIGSEATEFSPNRDRFRDTVAVYYSINEDVAESELKFFRGTAENSPQFGQPIRLEKSEGAHTEYWDGGDRNFNVFPDGQYRLTIRVVDKGGNENESDKTNVITIDTKPPLISRVVINENLTLLDGVFINTPILLIKVTADAAGGTPIDFTDPDTELTLKNKQGTTIPGGLTYDQTSLTLSLGNRLDTAAENGEYTASIAVADIAGNIARRTLNFTFDNIAPSLRAFSTRHGEFTPGGGVSGWLNYVEVTLSDNLSDGLNLADSTIRLTGPDGPVLGQQTQTTADKIRWLFLSPLIAADGRMDGAYTIEVNATDKAGNQTGALQIPFTYDNLPPLVTLGTDAESPFTLNQDTIYHAQPLSQIVATFEDAGVGVNLAGDTRVIFGTRGAGGEVNTLPGRVVRSRDRNQLAYILETPLTSRDGSQDGRYVLNVQATDRLGNTRTYNYHFVYDTQLPTLVSTVPAANASVSELSHVEIVLNEATSGIDFIQSTFRLTRDVGGNAVEVPVNITSDGTGTATLTLAQPIALDGSDDGTYTIEISPTDLAGNVGTTVRRQFYLVSQSRPEIQLAMPETATVNDLTTVVAELRDYIGAGIDFDASVVTVRNPQGNLIAQTKLEHDETNNSLTWNIDEALPRDGSADGVYTVTAIFVDFAGRRFVQQLPLLIDTQFPTIENVAVATDSQPELSTDSITTLVESFSQIVVTFEDIQEGRVSGIDFANMGVTFTNPSGESIFVNRLDDGENVLTLDFQALTELGEYVLSITPQDLAGNQSAAPLVYRLRVDVPLPTVTSVLIGDKLGTIVYVSGDSANIVATFADVSGAGLDLDDGGSTIAVTNETGLPAPGITTSNGTDQLTWTPIVLPTDGSADGRYTVTVTPKDKTGRQGEVVYRQFVYDTQEPRITAATPVSLIQPITYISGPLTQLQFTVEDVGPAGLALDEQTLELIDAQGAAVSTTGTFDEISSQLYLILDTPFAQDGSADGEYTLKLPLVDRAGNVLALEHSLIYDSQVPRVSSVSVNTESPMGLVSQEITEISESISSITVQFEDTTGIDFSNTQVTLTAPDAASIPITLNDDGVSALTVSFENLHEVGVYTLSVTGQDLAGNVAPSGITYRFVLDLGLPSVSSVMIGTQSDSVAYVNASNVVVNAVFLESAGIDLSLSEGSGIVVTSPAGTVVPGQTRADGENALIWQPLSLPTDGSADGRYTVAITPIDKAGRQGDVVHRQFIYDTESPRITASSPVVLSQPASYISAGLNQFVFTVEDVGPADLLLGSQTIALIDGAGEVVPATLTYDALTNQLYLTLSSPFARDGSVDGEYTVSISLVDRAGNVLALEHSLIYDSQVPGLSSVIVDTESPMELLPAQVGEVSESISSITLAFEESTKVDFANTVVTLVGPNETPVPLTLADDGTSQLAASFLGLRQVGLYTLSITPSDVAGNVATSALTYQFVLNLELPSVSGLMIGGKSADVVFINGSDATIIASLIDATGIGLVLGEGGSNIVVTSPAGTVVPGQTRSEGENQLIWEPISLPTDGSADGRYTVAVTPVDKAGRQGDVVHRQFIYDTESPRITASSPVVLSQPASYVSDGLNQLVFTVEDVGPADLLLDSQTITLIDGAESVVPATLTYDALTNQLYLTLSSPFARDGSVDGPYTLKLSLVDRAGNVLALEHSLIYDSQVPRVSSVSVNTESPMGLVSQEITEISESISSITVQFEDATGIDFSNTQVTLTAPDAGSVPITLNDDGVSALTVSFENLHEVGVYTLSVTGQDLAGNVAPSGINYRFVLDLGLPSISSVMIGAQSDSVAYVNASNVVVNAVFLESAGIDLSLSEGSSIVVTSPVGTVVPGQTRADGENALIWQPLSLPTDGSADGRYTVAITPVDKAGRQGDVVHRQFIYDTESPRITASSPMVLSQPASYISDGLNQFVFTVEDVGPADLLLDSQTIALIDGAGEVVPAALTYDALTNQLYLTLSSPFARDGSVDGPYTLKLSLVDRAGNVLALEHSLIYDSQVPRVSSVSVNTESPMGLVSQEITEISESISSITVQFEDTTGIDFSNTQVTLTAPDAGSVPITLNDDGVSALTVSFQNLHEVGVYTLSVTGQDLAGNVAPSGITYRFVLDLGLPSVSSVMIGAQSDSVAYVNASNVVVNAVFLESAGIDLSLAEGSSIVVTSPVGTVVPGQTRADGENALIWQPLSLPTDGSADGRYTVAITPVDKAGRQGDVVHRQFIYDTESPRITASSPMVLSQPASYISDGLNQFVFTVEDVGPADLLLDSQTIALIDGAGEVVPAALTYDALTNQLYLTLSSPFARDGSVDGPYTLKLSLVDRAGNVLALEHSLIYDSQVPRVSSVSVNTESPMGLVSQEITEISESISSITVQFEDTTGIDFSNTQVTLTAPDAGSVPITLNDDGVSALTVSFENLHEVGVYTLSVTGQDLAGNVAPSGITYRFVLDLGLPSVSSVMIGAQSDSVAYVNASNVVVNAVFLESAGIDLSLAEGSSIVVTSPVGTVVPGQTRADGENALIWQPLSLPTDGSADGRYTVAITPIDKAGRQGDVVYRQFIYDTESPRITASSPVVLSQPASYVSDGLNQLVFTVEDVGPADLLLGSQTITLIDGAGDAVPAALTYDALTNQLYLTLSSPFARDGSVDGPYTLKLSLVDRAGNVLALEHSLIYDSQVPRVSSVSVNTESPMGLVSQEITEISESISSLTVQFEDATGIDFTNTQVTLTAPDAGSIPITLNDDGASALTVSFQNLHEVGVYTLSVTGQDLAGNVAPSGITYRFVLDLGLPSVSSVMIGAQSDSVAYVNASNVVVNAVFLESAGIDLSLAEGSSIVVTSPVGTVVPGQTRADGENALIWQPLSLPTDGSADGRYTVAITPIDKAGRQGDVVYRQFIYDTESPRITASSPVVLSQPASYISDGLNQLVFTVEDVGPADLLLGSQTIALIDGAGEVVPATLTYDALTNQLYLTLSSPFARDGSVDGEYTVSISLVDRAGNVLALEHSLIYDSQVPRVSSVSVNTESPMGLVSQEITEISESISSLTVQFEDATGIDFTNTQVTLTAPDAGSIPITLNDDGASALTVSFQNLHEVGVYTLSVTGQDLAGNVAPSGITYRFVLDLGLPSVSSVMIGAQSDSVAYVNASNVVVNAVFLESAGIDLSLAEGSGIVVTNPVGTVVPGQTRADGENALIWEPISLPTDGSADGRYTVAVTPIDKAGRQGDVVHRQFIYDTESPRITASSPVVLSQPASYISDGLNQLVFTVEDVGPADLLLGSQTIALIDGAGEVVPATLTYDALTNQLYLTLSSPFARDGSVDGEYTVSISLVDRAGNVLALEHSLIYDSQVPRVSSVSVNTESPMGLVSQEITEISESISSLTVQFEDATGIDFTNTQVTLTAPDAGSIPITLNDDGASALTVSFQNLHEVGVYTLSVTGQDLAGNVAPSGITYRFVLDLGLPSVSSVMIGAQSDSVAYVNASNVVVNAVFLESAGIDLSLAEGSGIVVTNPVGTVVPGQTRADGENALIWEPISLPTDGSADGRYTVAVTPIDKAGRQGDVVHRQFIYDTESPRITASSPVVLSQPASYISDGLNQLVFTVEDVGPADLLLGSQTIALIDGAGEVVPATLTYDALTNQLYLTLSSPFARDGSVDGEYTVSISLVDRAGNVLVLEHSLIYDSQVPRLSSVTADTETPVALLPAQVGEVSESISSITLAFKESTKVDFANTVVTLVGPNETPVPLTLADDGTSQLTVSFLGLRQVGLYILSVTPLDIAGNVATSAITYQFVLNLELPSVSGLMIGGKSADVVFINGSDATIIATLIDATGIGLVLLGEGGSSIVVTSPSGTVVPGQTRADGENALIWQPLSLPTDGSADGRYTVAVTPVDKAGRQGDVVHRQFIYDTESPRITASSPVVLSQPASYVSDGLNQLVFTVEDVGPADLLLGSQMIALIDGAGNAVPATLTYDALTNQLYLTLSSPFARDGSVDGAYTLRLSLTDRAGNTMDLEHLLIYDSQVPQLSSVMVNTETPIELVPQGTAEVLEPISSITIQFDDATRIDFTNTVVTLVSSGVSATTGNPEAVNIPLTLQDDGISQITASFLELNQLDTYVLSVTPQDIAGNAAAAPINYTFILDIPLPRVSSVVISDTETGPGGDVIYVNASNMIIGAVLEDPTDTGLDFSSDGSDITVADASNTVVPGTTGSNGVDLLVWEPITLTTDGTTDGRYSVYVTPVDKAGREGNTVYREFIYDTQQPEITAADPINLSQPVSYISDSLTQFQFTVIDVGPADLELSDQKVTLRDTSGNLVSARLTNDTVNRLYLTLDQPLPRDGSMDGRYTIAVELVDKSGNAFTVEHQIVYDTQAPTLVSTVPTDGALLTEDITQIQVTLNDEGGSGIDWSMTTITLVNPSGQQIAGELVSNGTTTLTLSTNQLVEDGRYIVRVQAVDRAGNGGVTSFERSFRLSRRLPVIISTEPSTAPADEALTNEEIEQIEVDLETDDENHQSTLRLLNPANQAVAGQQERASGRLIYNLVRPLATDGSEDGVYTIEFTPISASGRSGEVQRLTFTYDTQAPEIESDDVIDLVVAQPGVNNSLIEIRVNLTDEISGIDWENLNAEWLIFEQLSPKASEISGRVDDDGQGNLTFRLTAPLADNGSADGEYRITVNPKDRAGNDDAPYEKVFIYDTSPPMIDAGTLLINDTPLLVDINADNYPTPVSTTGGVVIQANIFDTGLGVNLAQSKITVRQPDGAEVSGNTQQNGVDTIVFKSDGLTLQGKYQVEVTSIGNDSELLGFAPTDSITTEFLYETSEPTAAVSSDGGETELTDEPLPLEGTASDPAGTQRIGEGEIPVPASGVWLVEIIGIGPDDQPIDPVPAVDDSNAQEEPWSRWSIDFLPTRSGEYDLDVRVTDNAGNYAVYDIGKYTMSVSLTFRGSTFGWPNPLRLSQRDVAFFSFDVNVPLGETIELTLSIYDWSGDMVLSQTYPDVVSGQRNDQLVKWNLENQSGNIVARGLYIFRLEAVNKAGNRTNAVGKVLVVD